MTPEQKKAQREAQELELARINEEEEAKRRYALALAPATPGAKIDEEETQQNKKGVESPILTAYKEQFNKEPETDKQGRSILVFDSEEAATAFFKGMAEKNISFLCFEVNQNGIPSGNIMLSFGDGKLIEGKIPSDKIQEFQSKYSDYMREENPKNKADLKAELMGLMNIPNPAARFRQSMQAITGIDEQDQTAPTPFDAAKKPKPLP